MDSVDSASDSPKRFTAETLNLEISGVFVMEKKIMHDAYAYI